MYQEFLQKIFYNNRVLDYLVFLIYFLSGVAVIWIFKSIILRRLRKLTAKTEAIVDNIFLASAKWLVPILYYGVFYISIHKLKLGLLAEKTISVASIAVIIYLAVRSILALISILLNRYQAKRGSDHSRQHVYKGILTIARLIIWTFALLILLDNLGLKITALVTGLGIGGIAIALAAQTILGDLFSYFTIFFDKPFEIGDFIIIGEFKGTVEHIGIKTSRIRSLSGEELVFSNTDITNSRLSNYRRMERRRAIFKIGVTYNTPGDKLRIIPGLIKNIIESTEMTTFDRCHFQGFGDYSQDIETAYFIETRDYNKYMDIQQEINLRIREEFEKNGIEFAFPTQSIYIENQ
ncbi:MAG: mechanosensitive ion channel [Candidatus Krumholzibacteriota bacterium]|nr:mechanosensitive ion channel [Candidatus Krumholzibacteriota bacterium]